MTTDTIRLSASHHENYQSTTEDRPMVVMPPLALFPEFLLVISPFRRPITWSIINVLCMIWCYLLLDQFGEPGPRETEHGNELYLAWNFWTTFLWCLEAGLCSHYHYYHRHSMRRLDSLMDVVQFVVAVYFLVDSIQLYRASRRPGEKIYGEVTDVFLSLAAYLGASIYYMSLYYQGRSGQDEVPSCEREMTGTESEEENFSRMQAVKVIEREVEWSEARSSRGLCRKLEEFDLRQKSIEKSGGASSLSKWCKSWVATRPEWERLPLWKGLGRTIILAEDGQNVKHLLTHPINELLAYLNKKEH